MSNVVPMRHAVVFTGLVAVDKNIVGTAIIYKKIADLLVAAGYAVDMVVPEVVIEDAPRITHHRYGNASNKRLIDSASLVIVGAYPPVDPLLYAYKKKKTIVTYLWSIAPIGSLEFRDFSDKRAQHALHEYITASYNLSLLVADKIFCRDEQIRKFVLGSLTALGRIHGENYAADPQLRALVDVAPFGIAAEYPQHKKNVYRGVYPGIGSNDFLLIWNGGIWNWNDGETLIAVMRLLRKKKNIKLIFQGYRHPQKNRPLSREARRTIALATKYKLVDNNIFFIDDWQPYAERGNYLTECDAGVVTSPHILEANLFYKTRIYDYIWAGMPIIINDAEAFAPIVTQERLGVVAPTGDARMLAEMIAALARDKARCRMMRKNIRAYRQRILWGATLAPVRAYCRKPTVAKDKYNKDNALFLGAIADATRMVRGTSSLAWL